MKAVVCRIADNTLMGQIAGLAMSTDNEQTPINKEIQHFIKVHTGVLLCSEIVKPGQVHRLSWKKKWPSKIWLMTPRQG